MANFAFGIKFTYRFAHDDKLRAKLRTDKVIPALFSLPESDVPLKGIYKLVITGSTFEPDSTIDAEFVFHGQVFGWAGTDHARRDLSLPLLWGVPVALAFGLMAAIGTSVMTMIIAAIATWYGGWVDELIQRITEINLVLPFFALLIEAAKAYGASNMRIIFKYLIPRMIPLLIPGLVQSVPAFVFLEASLAVIGLGDPVLPTWGKIIQDANSNGALYKGYYYWVLEPAFLLIVTGLAFAVLGFALDRIFNPKLRDV